MHKKGRRCVLFCFKRFVINARTKGDIPFLSKETVTNAGESETEGKKLRYSDVLEEVRRNGASSVESIYSGVLSKLSDTKVLKKLLSMSKAERAFAKAGANAENITTAVIRAQGMPYDGNKEMDAYEYGLEQRKKGKGKRSCGN